MIDPSVFSRIAFPFRAATNSASMWNLPETSLHSRAQTSSPAQSKPQNAAGATHFRHVHGRYMPLPPGESALRRAPRQILRGQPLFAASPADSGVELLPHTVRPRRPPVQAYSAIRSNRRCALRRENTCTAKSRATLRADAWHVGRTYFCPTAQNKASALRGAETIDSREDAPSGAGALCVDLLNARL